MLGVVGHVKFGSIFNLPAFFAGIAKHNAVFVYFV